MTEPLYDRIGIGYSDYRRPDARIAARIDAALGPCRSVLNVGAGTGSYEPTNRVVTAIEPSAAMIRQRPRAAARAIQAGAASLPFVDRAFDASLAILTIHHWPDKARGLAELRRVARERVVILTWDPEHSGFWLIQDYLPQIREIDRRDFPTLREIETSIGPIETESLAIPADCADGFLGAYWRRPAAYLDPRARAAISIFSKLDATTALARLEADLADGTWRARHGALLALSELDVGYRLVVAKCK
ncbi:MAG TPA: methyltransferase domain-containing protein [Gammaproteobacteria bacterium]